MRFFKNLSIYAGIDVIGAFLGIITSPITTRLLTQKQYGTLPLIGAVWAIFTIASFGGMNWAYLFFRVRKELDQKSVIVTATLNATVSAILVVAFFTAIASLTPLIDNIVNVSTLELGLYLLFLLPGVLVDWYLLILRFQHQAASFARVAILRKVLSVIIALPFMYMAPQEHRLAVMIAGTGIISFAASLLGLYELKRHNQWPYSRTGWSWPLGKEMLSYGLFMIPGGIAYAMVAVIDRLMVGAIIGVEEVAIFSLATSLGMIVTRMKKWIGLTFNPYLVDWLADEESEVYQERLNKILVMLAVVFWPVVGMVAIWSGPLVALLYPPDYLKVAYVVPVIALSGTVSVFSMVAIATIILNQNKKTIFVVNLTALVINVAIGLALIPKFGATGAAVGTFFAETAILLCWFVFGSYVYRNLVLKWSPVLVGFVLTCAVLVFSLKWLSPGGGMIIERTLMTFGIVSFVLILSYLYRPLADIRLLVLEKLRR